MCENRYVFVCIANNSGSTLIDRYLAECENVCSFPPKIDAHERIHKWMPMPDYGKPSHVVWTERQNDYEDESKYNWENITNTFKNIWSQNPKFNDSDRYLICKSPIFVSMVPLLKKYFPQSFFILSVRNIYSCCEGLRRRWKIDIERAARHFIRIFELQKKNLGYLKDDYVFYTYSELCNNPSEIKEKLISKLPLLNDLDFNKEVYCHNLDGPYVKKSISSYNNKQIENLSKEDIEKINRTIYCMNAKDLIESFGFKIINEGIYKYEN